MGVSRSRTGRRGISLCRHCISDAFRRGSPCLAGAAGEAIDGQGAHVRVGVARKPQWLKPGLRVYKRAKLPKDLRSQFEAEVSRARDQES
jgi:hypothetical protein